MGARSVLALVLGAFLISLGDGRRLSAITIQATTTDAKAGCINSNGNLCDEPQQVYVKPVDDASLGVAGADAFATAQGLGSYAQTTVDRTIISGPVAKPKDIATTRVDSSAINPTTNDGTAATTATVRDTVGLNNADTASAAGTGSAQSESDGTAKVNITGAAKASTSRNVATGNILASAAGTNTGGPPNMAYGTINMNTDSTSASVNIPRVAVSGQDLRLVANETAKVGGTIQAKAYNNITATAKSTGPGAIELQGSRASATQTAAQATMDSFEQASAGKGSSWLSVAQGESALNGSTKLAQAYNKVAISSGSNSDLDGSNFNSSFTRISSRVQADPRLATASIDDFRADADDEATKAYAFVSGNATSKAMIDSDTSNAKSVVKFRANDGKVLTDAYSGLAWRVHGNAYSYTVAKKDLTGNPQAFAIGTVPGGNEYELGINSLSGSWIASGRAAYLQGRPPCKTSACSNQRVAYAFGSQANSVKINGVTTAVSWSDANEADDWKPDSKSGIVGIENDPYVNTGLTWSTMDPLTGRGKTVFWVNKCTDGECPRALVPPTQTGLNFVG